MCPNLDIDVGNLEKNLKESSITKAYDESWGGSNWQDRFGGQFDESWGGGNWMDRLGLGEFKDGMGGGDNSNQEKTDAINALKQVTTGAGFGGSKAAKFSTNKKNAVGKKALVIKKPRGK